VAFSNGERVVPLDLGLVATPGAPYPVLLQNDWNAFLVFYLAAIDPSGDAIGIVEWIGCTSTSFGYPNEEALSGHRLWDRGLSEVHWCGEVLNSSWIAEMEIANRVHFMHDPANWATLRHFILPFQDSTFECAADDYLIETTNEPMNAVVSRLVLRLFGDTSP
jgi:hypothetical protein